MKDRICKHKLYVYFRTLMTSLYNFYEWKPFLRTGNGRQTHRRRTNLSLLRIITSVMTNRWTLTGTLCHCTRIKKVLDSIAAREVARRPVKPFSTLNTDKSSFMTHDVFIGRELWLRSNDQFFSLTSHLLLDFPLTLGDKPIQRIPVLET